jgi:transposase-like protein
MNDVDAIDGVVKRATRRKHSARFKAEVLEACRQPDASAAAIARLYNLNANVVHRWRADDRKAALTQSTDVPTLPMPDFIALGALLSARLARQLVMPPALLSYPDPWPAGTFPQSVSLKSVPHPKWRTVRGCRPVHCQRH